MAKMKKYIYRRLRKKTFLEGVKGRLENDVGSYFDCITDVMIKKRKSIGYWGLVRLILPVIEAVADVIYKRTGKKDNRPQRLLAKLGIDYPNVVWEIFRNSLIHTDNISSIYYRGKRISWSIGYATDGCGTDHIFAPNHIYLDMRRLYNDFIIFLESEIVKAGDKCVYIEDGVKIGIGKGRKRISKEKELRREFKALTNPSD